MYPDVSEEYMDWLRLAFSSPIFRGVWKEIPSIDDLMEFSFKLLFSL